MGNIAIISVNQRIGIEKDHSFKLTISIKIFYLHQNQMSILSGNDFPGINLIWEGQNLNLLQ